MEIGNLISKLRVSKQLFLEREASTLIQIL